MATVLSISSLPYYRIIFLVIFGIFATSCVSLPTYIHPSINDANNSEIATINTRWAGCPFCIRVIKGADGEDIPVTSSERHPMTSGTKPFEAYRLPPGEYTIWYSHKGHKTKRVSGSDKVTLKAGHVYRVAEESCYWPCARMDTYTADIWLEDMTTGKRIAGCRQGMGCCNETAGRQCR